MTFSPRAVEAAARAIYDLPLHDGDAFGTLIYMSDYIQPSSREDMQRQSIKLMEEIVRAALSAALAVDGVALQGWKPIKSAPKDGTEILLASIQQVYKGASIPDRVTSGHWTTEEECREPIGDCGGECRCPEYKYHEPFWLSWDGGFTEENPPTHWQPLPPPPAASDGEERDSPPKEKS